MQLFVETVKKLHGLDVIKHDSSFEELETPCNFSWKWSKSCMVWTSSDMIRSKISNRLSGFIRPILITLAPRGVARALASPSFCFVHDASSAGLKNCAKLTSSTNNRWCHCLYWGTNKPHLDALDPLDAKQQ